MRLNLVINDVLQVELDSEAKTVTLYKVFGDTTEQPGAQDILELSYSEFVGMFRALESLARI